MATQSFPLVLIDEPEAFLHPPQARALGREIARLSTKGGTQAIVATHSADVLRGVLEISEVPVTVVRLTREGALNRGLQIAADDIRRLWADAILRYSNVLDGLFYKQVVVCEAEPDCRYYSAVLDRFAAQVDFPVSPWDLLFVPSGGKDKVFVVVGALRAIGVPVKVAADFDVLRDRTTMERLVGAAGGDWQSLSPLWKRTTDAIGRGGRGVLVDLIRAPINQALDGSGSNLTESAATTIRSMLTTNDSWATPKRSGLAGVPAGNPKTD